MNINININVHINGFVQRQLVGSTIKVPLHKNYTNYGNKKCLYIRKEYTKIYKGRDVA